MARLKTGTRLKSAVCNTQVMVVAAPDADVDVRCGGHPMLDAAATPPRGARRLARGGQGHDARQALRERGRQARAALHQAGRGLARGRRRGARPQGSEAAPVVGLTA